MKISDLRWSILLVLFFFIITVPLFYLITQKVNNLALLNGQLLEENALLQNLILYNIKTQNINVSFDNLLDENNHQVEIVGDNLLVFHISEANCMECIKSEIPLLKETMAKGVKVVVIGEFSNRQAFLAIRAHFPFFSNFYWIKNSVDPTHMLLNEMNNPFYYIYNSKTRKSSFLMYPLKQIQGLSQKYLLLIERVILGDKKMVRK